MRHSLDERRALRHGMLFIEALSSMNEKEPYDLSFEEVDRRHLLGTQAFLVRGEPVVGSQAALGVD